MKSKAKQKPVVDISFPEIEKFDKLPEPRQKVLPRMCRSWKAAANIVVFVLFLIPAAKKLAVRLMM